MKKIIRSVARECTLVFYCDMHGHSKNRDVFIYGNTDSTSPSQYRLFPIVLSRLCPAFSLAASCFQVERTKLTTARVTVWKEFELYNVFTLEASFFGSTTNRHYEVEDYMDIGRKVCLAVFVCHRLGLASFSQSGRVGAALFDKSVPFDEDEVACGCLLKDLRELLRSKLPFQDAPHLPLSLIEDCEPLTDNSPGDMFSILVSATKRGTEKTPGTSTGTGNTSSVVPPPPVVNNSKQTEPRQPRPQVRPRRELSEWSRSSSRNTAMYIPYDIPCMRVDR